MKFTRDQLIEMMDANNGDLILRRLPVTELPDNLTVPGNLVVEDTVPLEVLPDGLTVCKDLHIAKSNVQEIGEQVRVGGNLEARFSGLERIGKYLRVEKDFLLDSTPLEILPEGLFVGGDLDLRNTSVRMLSDNSTVGTLYVEVNPVDGPIKIPTTITVLKLLRVDANRDKNAGSQLLVGLPDGLTIDGALSCNDIQIPKGLTVKGYCRFWTSSEKMPVVVPPDLKAKKALDLSNYGKLDGVPGTIEVGGDLGLPPTVRTLGTGLTVGGSLVVDDPGRYRYGDLPAQTIKIRSKVRIGGNFILEKEQRISCLPDDMEIGGRIWGMGIGGLPESWEVINGDLDIGPAKLPGHLRLIKGRVRLDRQSPCDALPEGLTIEGDLEDFRENPQAKLPRNLVVRGDITMKHLVDKLPAGLSVRGHIKFRGAAFSAEPEEIILRLAHLIESLPSKLEVKTLSLGEDSPSYLIIDKKE